MTPVYVIDCRNSEGDELRFELRRCDETHLALITGLQDRVIDALPDRDIFARTTEEEILESLRLDFCLGAFAGDELAMASIMIINRVSPRNLGTYLGYDTARLLETVTYDTTFVAGKYRGYGLQRHAGRIKDARALALGAKEALVTVSPFNSVSLNNLIGCGFAKADRQTLYDGADRLIMRKELKEHGEFDIWDASGRRSE